MTARSRERGSHAGRPRNYGLPFTVPGLSGLGSPGSLRNGRRSSPAPAGPSVAAELPVTPAGPGAVLPGDAQGPAAVSRLSVPPPPNGAPRPSDAPPPGGPARRRGHRHRKPPSERRSSLSRKYRLPAALLVVIGVLGVGFANGFGGAGSAVSTVQAFLLDWQQGDYTQAAALTSGGTGPVRAQLAAAYTDLDATNAFFAMSGVTQHGDTAVATYKATVDLAQAGQRWSYSGQFGLTSRNGQWVVDWAPSVINPHLGAGDRLAVVTAYAPRAGVVDTDGQSLLAKTAAYRVGVYPGKLKDPAATAAAFAAATGLDEQQVLGQIQSAPPSDFLSLLTLAPAGMRSLSPKLSKVPGLSHQQQAERLFSSSAPEVVGQVGTENASELRQEGAAYQPGMTVGLTGFEQMFQTDLIGTPTSSVVVVNAAGRTVAKLWSSPGGHAGTPVRTTLTVGSSEGLIGLICTLPCSWFSVRYCA